MSTIQITTGEPGAGKTYVRAVRFLLEDFLPNGSGMHISNFPLNVDEISVYMSRVLTTKKPSGFWGRLKSLLGFNSRVVSPDEIKARIRIIPEEVLQSWHSCQSGPWEYFADADLQGAHIALDEIQELIGVTCLDKDYIDKWDQFLGTIRHRGCTFEGLTQDLSGVHSVFKTRAGIRYEIVPCDSIRDFFFKIRFSDWYNLKAAFTGFFDKRVYEIEKRKAGSGRWVTNNVRAFYIVPEYFRFWNSYNASMQEKTESTLGVKDGSRAPLQEYQKRGKIALVWWFVSRNAWNLFSRFVISGVVIWLCFMGGFPYLIKQGLASLQHSKKADKLKSAVSLKSASDLKALSSSIVSYAVDSDLSKKKSGKYIPVLLTPDYFILSGGLRIYKGYIFKKDSFYAGKKVVFLDFRSRSFALSDGSVVSLYDVTD